VSFDLNVTVASTPPTVAMDPNTTRTTPAKHQSIATPTSNVNPSVSIPNLVQPFMHSIGRAVAQVSALLRLTTPSASQTTRAPGGYQPFLNPTMHCTATNPSGAPAHPIPQSFSHLTPGTNLPSGVQPCSIGFAPGNGLPPSRHGFPGGFLLLDLVQLVHPALVGTEALAMVLVVMVLLAVAAPLVNLEAVVSTLEEHLPRWWGWWWRIQPRTV
jgi:hypothetical protein